MNTSWKLINKSSLFNNKYHRIENWVLRTHEGQIRDYSILKGYDFVVVVPITSDKKIIMIKQFYIAQLNYHLSLVSGFVDKKESPLQTAVRELKEETGFTSNDFICIGSNSKGKYITGNVYYYIALNAKYQYENKLTSSEDIKLDVMDFNLVHKILKRNQIKDVFIEIALYKAINFIDNAN